MGSMPQPPSLSFPDDQQLFQALGSEALILQNKRSALTGEATNRSSLFVAIVSGSLVAAGFVLRTSYAFSFLVIVLPVVLVLGTVTFFRLATIARDDRRLDSQLEWLRSGFRQLSPRGAAYLPRPGSGGADRSSSPVPVAVVLTSAAGFVGLLDAAIVGLGVALMLGELVGGHAEPTNVAVGALVSGATASAMVLWLRRGTSSSWAGPTGTPAPSPDSATR